jgi:hypothetical protein
MVEKEKKMIVVVQGTNEFNDYSVFIRAMGVALSGMKDEDQEFAIYSVGPARTNAMVSEFSNLSERGMKARGKKIKYYKVPGQWVEENMMHVNYFAFLCKPKQTLSKLVAKAELENIEVGVFSY